MTLTAMCHRDLAERERALSYLRRAVETDPAFEKAQYQLAVVLQELGRNEDAAEQFSGYTKTEIGQTHALAWSLFGVALRNVGKFEESASAIEKAITLVPEDIPTRNALVITHFKAENNSAAVEAGRRALELKDRVATNTFNALDFNKNMHWRTAPFDASDRSRNIISFSLWGDNPVYTHGAIVNAQLAPHVYPGWRCRFYCDESVPDHVRRELRRLGAQIEMITDPKLFQLKPLWRFFASDDPGIDRFVCRDADSRLNSHEAVAVDDWIKSGLPFHIMRDHIYHMEVILAGMWGGVSGVLPNVHDLADVALGYRRNKWNDQEFLRDIVWPLVRDHSRVHDSIFGFRGAGDFPDVCRLPGKVHVGGAIKSMPDWPHESWKKP